MPDDKAVLKTFWFVLYSLQEFNGTYRSSEKDITEDWIQVQLKGSLFELIRISYVYTVMTYNTENKHQ